MEKEAYEFIKNTQYSHWWFKGRKKIIESVFNRFLKKNKKYNILEIGAGYGAQINLLNKYKNIIDVIEPYEDAINFLKNLGINNIYPFIFPEKFPDKKYDMIVLFDVLEHIKEDKKALKIIYNRLLKNNGILFLTVPAYMWLFSYHDEIHKHYRRYTKKELYNLLSEIGFKNIYISYYSTILFPLAVSSRMIIKLLNLKKTDLTETHNFLNKILEIPYYIEAKIISKFSLPFGLNIIVKAEK